MRYPLMFGLRQKLHGPKIEDVPAAVDAELSTLNLGSKVRAGDTVAIACGRRPMTNYVAIMKAVVDHFRHLKASPFLVPALGIHRPETTERQREILQDSGINEDTVGAEIRWSMETKIIGQLPEGVPIHWAAQALA